MRFLITPAFLIFSSFATSVAAAAPSAKQVDRQFDKAISSAEKCAKSGGSSKLHCGRMLPRLSEALKKAEEHCASPSSKKSDCDRYEGAAKQIIRDFPGLVN